MVCNLKLNTSVAFFYSREFVIIVICRRTKNKTNHCKTLRMHCVATLNASEPESERAEEWNEGEGWGVRSEKWGSKSEEWGVTCGSFGHQQHQQRRQPQRPPHRLHHDRIWCSFRSTATSGPLIFRFSVFPVALELSHGRSHRTSLALTAPTLTALNKMAGHVFLRASFTNFFDLRSDSSNCAQSQPHRFLENIARDVHLNFTSLCTFRRDVHVRKISELYMVENCRFAARNRRRSNGALL